MTEYILYKSPSSRLTRDVKNRPTASPIYTWVQRPPSEAKDTFGPYSPYWFANILSRANLSSQVMSEVADNWFEIPFTASLLIDPIHMFIERHPPKERCPETFTYLIHRFIFIRDSSLGIPIASIQTGLFSSLAKPFLRLIKPFLGFW